MASGAPVRPFTDPARKPTDAAVDRALGPSSVALGRLLGLSSAFDRDWQFAGKSGWMLKVHARGKALFYAIPLDGSFRVSMAIRDNERAALADDPDLDDLRETLLAAKRYAEGYALAFDVVDPAPAPVERLVARLVTMRAQPPRGEEARDP